MNNIHVVCQYCGVNLEVEDDVASFDCPNCGARLHTKHYVLDESEMDYGDHVIRNRNSVNQSRKSVSLAAIVLAIIIFVVAGFYIGSVKPGPIQDLLVEAAGTPKPTEQVRWPLTYREAKKKSYSELSALLKERRFTNIKGTPVTIPKVNISRIKVGQIKEIYIIASGKTYHNNDIKKNQEFSSDVEIAITYYR